MTPRRLRRLACLALVGLGLAASVHAAPGDRKTLVLRGRASGLDSWPVIGAKVVAREGGRARATAITDAVGQYVLTIPLGTPGELAKRPLELRIGAQRRGWRLALPNGIHELGLSLRVVGGDDGVARCEIRSNLPGVAADVARVMGADGNATSDMAINFLGVEGDEAAVPETLELPALERVALAGVRALTAAELPAVAKPDRKKKAAPEPRLAADEKPVKKVVERAEKTDARTAQKTDGKTAEKATEKARKRKTAPAGSSAAERAEPVAANVPAAAPPSTPATSQKPATKGAGDAERELAAAKRRAEQEGSPAGEEARRMRESTREGDRIERTGHAEEKARQRVEERRRREAEHDAEKELKRQRAEQDDRWAAIRREVHLIAGAADTTAPPPLAKLAGMAPVPSTPADRRERAGAAARLVPSRDTVAVTPPRGLPEPIVAQAPPPPLSDRERAALRDAGRSSPANGGPSASAPSAPAPVVQVVDVPRRSDDEKTPVIPRPDGEPRTRARPLLIRTPGVRSAEAAARRAAGDGDSCSCRITGTVEVRSDRPLPARARIAVSLVWYPMVTDTVELFMGSPRTFVLAHVPCGPQRLRVVSLGGQRFDVVSREAMAGFRCEGYSRQLRLVLEPAR